MPEILLWPGTAARIAQLGKKLRGKTAGGEVLIPN
jgi:hypothetical protein